MKNAVGLDDTAVWLAEELRGILAGITHRDAFALGGSTTWSHGEFLAWIEEQGWDRHRFGGKPQRCV